jgi:hypothetical protein
VTKEEDLDTDEPNVGLRETHGRINCDLTVGADVTKAAALHANAFICSPGVKLHGDGFIVTPAEAEHLGLGHKPGLENHIRHYRNGRDLTGTPRGVMVIDLDGLTAEEVRRRFPKVYQHLLATVKPQRDRNNEEYRRIHWWLFGRKNTLMRGFTAGLPRYIATVETAKHRVFQFLDASILPDNKLVCIGLADAYHLGVLSSRAHVLWALRAGGQLGPTPVWMKTICFDPFPFPNPPESLKNRIRATAEELDALRKNVQAEHPGLTLTQIYNVLEKLRSGERLVTQDEAIKTQCLVLILKEHHKKLDQLVAEAYGWRAGGGGKARARALAAPRLSARALALSTHKPERKPTRNSPRRSSSKPRRKSRTFRPTIWSARRPSSPRSCKPTSRWTRQASPRASAKAQRWKRPSPAFLPPSRALATSIRATAKPSPFVAERLLGSMRCEPRSCGWPPMA